MRRGPKRYKLEISIPERLARVKYYTTMQGARNAAEKVKLKRRAEETSWAHVITRPLFRGDEE